MSERFKKILVLHENDAIVEMAPVDYNNERSEHQRLDLRCKRELYNGIVTQYIEMSNMDIALFGVFKKTIAELPVSALTKIALGCCKIAIAVMN